MGDEKRKERRFALSLPVQVRPRAPVADPVDSNTKDISASGICFLLPEKVEVGAEVEWEVTLPAELGPASLRIHCKGRILRVDPPDALGRIAVAATLDSYHFVRHLS